MSQSTTSAVTTSHFHWGSGVETESTANPLAVTTTFRVVFYDGTATFLTCVTSDEAFLQAVGAERAKAVYGLPSRRVRTVEVAQ